MSLLPENHAKFEAIVNAKAWKDPSFKKQLLADPKAALKSLGLDIPNDWNIRIAEDGQKTYTLVLRQPPQDIGDMNEEELKKVAGGKGVGGGCDDRTFVSLVCTGGCG